MTGPGIQTGALLSVFVDASAFFITHHLGSEKYDRCVGRTFPFAEIKLLNVATGREVPEGTVG